jgi:phage terminase small subunit
MARKGLRTPERTTPTLKQKKFIKSYLETGNATQAVIDAGYNSETREKARSTASSIKNASIVKKTIEKVLDEEGLSDEKLAGTLHSIIDKGAKSDRITASDSLRGIEMSYRLKDRFPAERKQIETKNFSMTLKGSTAQELTQQLQELLDESKKFANMMILEKLAETETDDV